MTAETEHPAIIADSADMTGDTATTASAKAGTLAAGPSGTNAAEGVYYTVQETAQMLKVSERTIWRWIHGGRLAAGKFGRAYRVTGAAINALWNPVPVQPDDEQRKEKEEEREELEQIALDARIQEYGNDADEGY